MRRWGGLASLAVASAALAGPATAPRAPTWADWVGDWEGKVRWSACAADGQPEATFAVDATDGAMGIDLGPAGAEFPALSLAEDNGGWVGQQGDVTVHVTRPRPETLAVAVDLDSGCQMRAVLHRDSVGIPACDQLSAWARIEARCTKLARPPLENPARVARQHARWTKARGADRSALATQCEARASKVENELVDAGCAPNPDPAIGLRGAECQAVRQTASRIARCPSLPADVRSLLARDADALAAAAQTAAPATLHVVETECRQMRERLEAEARHVGCPP